MTGIIILAAGASTRLGSPKQNLVFEGHTLLQRAIDTAMKATGHSVTVILGANADLIKPTVSSYPVQIIDNDDWNEGMATSIHLGVYTLKMVNPQIDSAILMLCDQPFVDVLLLNKLIEAKSKYGIIAAAYNDTVGAPVLFNEKYFNELLMLQGQEGAKKLLLKYPDDVWAIPFPLGAIDIDTAEDYDQLK